MSSMVQLFVIQSQSCAGTWLLLKDGRTQCVCQQVDCADTMCVSDIIKLVDIESGAPSVSHVDIVRNVSLDEVGTAR